MNTTHQPDHWATDTFIEDSEAEFPMVTHTRDYVDGDFIVILSRTIGDLEPDVHLKWGEWGANDCVDPEEFTVSVGNIPALIAALQRAHATLTAQGVAL